MCPLNGTASWLEHGRVRVQVRLPGVSPGSCREANQKLRGWNGFGDGLGAVWFEAVLDDTQDCGWKVELAGE